MDYFKAILGGIVGGLLVLAVSAFGGQSFGAAVNLTTVGNPWSFTNTSSNGGVVIASTTATNIQIGTSNGTRVQRVNFGTCNLFSGPGITSIGATSSVTLDCQATSGGASSTALTGVAAGDVCSLHLATTSPTTHIGLLLSGVGASTTQGYITADVINGTGAAYTLAAAATSTLEYMCFDPA